MTSDSSTSLSQARPRILTGDTPTGRLHLGHWVGSLENRVRLQDEYESFFIIANHHALTTRVEKSREIREDTLGLVIDWLSVGIDPKKSAIFIQSEVPAIAELSWYFAMLVPFNRVMRNPTLKTEIESKGLGDHYSFGFPMYAVGQIADILAFRADLVPVGEDQVPHLELSREAARRFNQLFCGVDSHADDAEHAAKGVFPIPEPKVGRIARLMGIDGAPKMGKSLGNAILLSDTAKQVQKKCNKIFTGRQSATDPGKIEGNPLWQYHDAFNPNADEVADMKAQYQAGTIGDGDCKKRLAQCINEFLEPVRERRIALEADPDHVMDVLRDGTKRANEAAEETLWLAKQAMGYDFFPRELR